MCQIKKERVSSAVTKIKLTQFTRLRACVFTVISNYFKFLPQLGWDLHQSTLGLPYARCRIKHESGHHLRLRVRVRAGAGCDDGRERRLLRTRSHMGRPVQLLARIVAIRGIPATIEQCLLSTLGAPLLPLRFLNTPYLVVLHLLACLLNRSQPLCLQTCSHLAHRTI